MSRSAWFALGLAVGIDLTFAILATTRHLDALARQSVRAPGARVVTIDPGSAAAIERMLQKRRRQQGRKPA